MSRFRMVFLLAGLPCTIAAMAGPVAAQPARVAQFAPPSIHMPRGSVAPSTGLIPAQPVAPQVPGVLSNDLPPRYDGLALGHGQFSNQPAPFVPDRPALSPRRYQRDLLGAGQEPEGDVTGGAGSYGNIPGAGHGAVPYGAAPYPVPFAVPSSGGTFGSSTRIDGE